MNISPSKRKGILQGEITQSLYFHFVFIFVSQQISVKSRREGDLSHATISHRKYTEPWHLCPQQEDAYGVRTRRLHPTGAGHHSLIEKDSLKVTGETSTPGSLQCLIFFCLWPCKVFKTTALDKVNSRSFHLLTTSHLCLFAARKLWVRHMWPMKYVSQNWSLWEISHWFLS